jgi:hypothetical protein
MCRQDHSVRGGARSAVALVAFCVAAAAPAATVRSYSAQFVVGAPDVQYASELAQLCEETHESVLRQLGTRGHWDGQASVWVTKRTVKGDDGPESLWQVSVSRGGITKSAQDLWYDQVETALRRAVCYHVLRDIAVSSAASHNATLRGRSVPFWLYAGLAESLELDGRLDLYVNTATAIDQKRSFLLEDLFAHDGTFETAEQRGIFLQQAVTVVEFLLAAKRGPERVRHALEHLWRRSSFTFSLRWEFGDLFPTLEMMANAWEQYVRERPSHMITEQQLTLAETDAALAEILAVRIPVIDDETIEQSTIEADFDGLSRHQNRQVVQRICAAKQVELFELALRSAPEFKPALEAYDRALKAIGAGHRRRFRRWYKRAQRKHEGVRALPYFDTGREE